MPSTVPRVVVVGGAVLDTKLRTTSAPALGTSNPGTATSTVGGVGRNVAENLGRLGTRTALVAAVGEDVAGGTVVTRTAAAGVECRHVVLSSHPTGTYTAVLDERGDLLIAVSDMRATDELTAADLEVVPSLLEGVDALVVDANLRPTVLRWLLAEAASAGVVVVLEPVSVAKAAAAGPTLDGAAVHTVTPNLDELAALVGGEVGATVDAILEAAAELHARGVSHVWVRRGTGGSVLSAAAGPARRAWSIAAPPTDVADVTGAGDSMTAGYLHALLHGDGPLEAARFGQVCAALTCASSETVRSDLSAARVAAHLTPTDPLVEELTP